MNAVLAVPLLAALVVLAIGSAASSHLVPVRREVVGARGRPGSATSGRWRRGRRGRQAASRCDWSGRDRSGAAPTGGVVERPSGHPVAWFTGRTRPTDRPPGDAELGAWCERVARSLRSGDSLRTAVRAAPTGPDHALAHVLAPIHLALDRGATVASAIAAAAASDTASPARTALLDRPDGRADATTAGLAMVRSVLTATAELGGSGAEALDRTATVLRQRHADAAERRVHAAQARLSAIVLTVLPVATGALLLTLDPEIRAASTGPIGLAVIALGVTLDGLGWWWMRRIVGGGP